MLVCLGLFEVILQEVHEVVSISHAFSRIFFPTGVGVVNGFGDKGHLAIGLHQLEIGPSADGHYLRILLTHIVDIVLDGTGIYLSQIEVTLVDDLVISCTVEQAIVTILQILLVVDDVSNAVATVGGSRNEVAAHIAEQLVLLHHILDVTKNAQVEIDSIISTEILAVTIHIGRQHIFAGCGGNTKSQKEDEEA